VPQQLSQPTASEIFIHLTSAPYAAHHSSASTSTPIATRPQNAFSASTAQPQHSSSASSELLVASANAAASMHELAKKNQGSALSETTSPISGGGGFERCGGEGRGKGIGSVGGAGVGGAGVGEEDVIHRGVYANVRGKGWEAEVKQVCWRVLTYADECWRVLAYADVHVC
jgi:hypothetical protein